MSESDRRFIVIGTAGHVDHGKTELVRTLTGVDTDRLKEEKERGLSIELGFAPLDLPSGQRVGMVDVPGHEKFIKNMLAGAAGVDLAILVVAADEGVMPQTREHLDILQILQITSGIVVVSKVDLVDPELLELAELDIRDNLAGTFLADAPMVRFSAVTREGADEVIAGIDELAGQVEPKTAAGPLRLPIDRVFIIAGAGTVVTGTLMGGSIATGEKLRVYPKGKEVRVRRVQVHDTETEAAKSGQRVALNLVGVEPGEIERGDVIAKEGTISSTRLFEGRLTVTGHAPASIKNGMRLRVHIGSAEVIGRVTLLDSDELKPGESGFGRIRLERPAATVRGDRYVVRRYSPMHTLGGGVVLDTSPTGHRRHSEATLQELRLKEAGDPLELAEAVLRRKGDAMTPGDLAKAAGVDAEVVRQLMQDSGKIVRIGKGAKVAHAETLARLREKISGALDRYHKENPLKVALKQETLRSMIRPKPDPDLFRLALDELQGSGLVRADAGSVSLSGAGPSLTKPQESIRSQIEAMYGKSGINSPLVDEVMTRVSGTDEDKAQVIAFLCDSGTLVRLDQKILMHKDAVDRAWAAAQRLLLDVGWYSAATLRDALGTSRKYSIPLVEYFDSKKLTRRVGDKRYPFKPEGKE
jgi:selenocysteine-specific elongation factor